MTYIHHRYYDSSLGRFVTEDPAKDGLNWYVYCNNNPLRYVDPDGLEWFDGQTWRSGLEGIDTAITIIDTAVAVAAAGAEVASKPQLIEGKGQSGAVNGLYRTLPDPKYAKYASRLKGASNALMVVATVTAFADGISTGIESQNLARGIFRTSRNMATIMAGYYTAKAVGTGCVVVATGLSGGTLAVPGAIASVVIGAGAGIAASMIVDSFLGDIENRIFGEHK